MTNDAFAANRWANQDRPIPDHSGTITLSSKRWKPSFSDLLLLVCIGVLTIAAPFLGGFYIYMFTLAGIYAIVTLGNNLLLSHAGLLSLAQGGLVAIGAYACGYAARSGLPFLATLVAGSLAAALCGFVIGLPALRLRGHFLSLVTLSFALAVFEIIIVLEDFTGGNVGLPVTENTLSPILNFYAVLGVVALVTVSQSILLSTRTGIALRLVRDSERAAAASGINIAKYKLVAFIYAGILAGVSGTFFVSATGYLAPSMFDVWLQVYILVAVVIGGMGPPAGAVFGAVLIEVIPQLTSAYQGLSSIILGIALLAVLLGARSTLSRRVQALVRQR
jgi:branched-chain amino acid transport system permease protein